MRPDQFDVEVAVWDQPAEATRTAKPHRVPLSRQALDLLAEARKASREALVFPGSRPGTKMGNSVMMQALRVAGIGRRGTVSGRASRTGRGSTTWTNGSRTSRWRTSMALPRWSACAGDDLLEERRPVMQRWADCTS